MHFLGRVLILMASMGIVAVVLPGLHFESLLSLFLAAVIVGLANAILRPLLILFTLPLVIISLGLFVIVINALLLYIASWLVSGFEVRGFWWAVLGSLMISLVSFLLNRMVAGGPRHRT
jgi:putative membrane protein